ncbi:3-deoxy-D-manno-octulosonic acid transferase [Shimia sp. SK013]|uniref:3-deoxy-D-manno-octulosonic acid transferase n=1 Tax=Shimia sp. SK013 TaxID=1389006 RepID=UPI0006B41B9E|nr:glycosyltransferase N-terminal domain-containing protein [Shimia sp. SK013]KPA21832.1 3-deoxy-D-manno-octulosonic acid transferase [Shimia sp. SK013]
MILKIFMLFYRFLWAALLPLILLYLYVRGRKDSIYRLNIAERFGFYKNVLPQNPIWVHAVSLGEVRSGIALIQAVLERGDTVLVSNFTPAGRREAEKQFAAEIEAGQLAVIWVPFDMSWCHRRLIKACRPRICLPLEVEVWPAMIETMRKAKVPLYLCNAQYGSQPMARDDRGLRVRRKIIARCTGAFVKSGVQKDRFEAIGLRNVVVTGELRFDQPIPSDLTEAASSLRHALQAPERQIFTIASGVADEEDLYREMILSLRKKAKTQGLALPLVVYVPRAPERFRSVGDSLERAGLKVCRRSEAFSVGTENLSRLPTSWASNVDVFLGDSLGEMYFYLSLADKVIVGGGFNERGAHNIIEPLAVGKPVLVGPHTWPIEFPFVEAEAAGVARSFANPEDMMSALLSEENVSPAKLSSFVGEHRGASARTLEGIDEVAVQSE